MQHPLVHAACISLLLCASSAARAQDLDLALDHYRAGRIPRALDAFTAVRESPVQEPALLLTAHLYLGLLRAAMGDELSARRDFAVALALDPDLSAPSELSPSLRRVFDEVRASTEPLVLRLDVPQAPVAGEDMSLSVQTRGGPPDLVAAIRLRATATEGAPWLHRVEGHGVARVSVPASAWRGRASLDIDVEALTVHGGVLVRETRRVAAAPPPLAAAHLEETSARERPVLFEPAAEAAAGGSVLEEPWLWVVVGLVVAGAAIASVVGVVASQDVYSVGAPRVETRP